VIKDAATIPDVTHGALVLATVRQGAAGSGVQFKKRGAIQGSLWIEAIIGQGNDNL